MNNEVIAVAYIHRLVFRVHHLLRFLVSRVFAAASAKLLKLKALRCRLFILRRYIITAFAIRTLKRNIVARHSLFLKTQDHSLSTNRRP